MHDQDRQSLSGQSNQQHLVVDSIDGVADRSVVVVGVAMLGKRALYLVQLGS